jgi:endogenous inhibitor of DNA gyrase (YacG/DUF329 family)
VTVGMSGMSVGVLGQNLPAGAASTPARTCPRCGRPVERGPRARWCSNSCKARFYLERRLAASSRRLPADGEETRGGCLGIGATNGAQRPGISTPDETLAVVPGTQVVSDTLNVEGERAWLRARLPEHAAQIDRASPAKIAAVVKALKVLLTEEVVPAAGF